MFHDHCPRCGNLMEMTASGYYCRVCPPLETVTTNNTLPPEESASDIRNAALEEAAVVCDTEQGIAFSEGGMCCGASAQAYAHAADAIRALKVE